MDQDQELADICFTNSLMSLSSGFRSPRLSKSRANELQAVHSDFWASSASVRSFLISTLTPCSPASASGKAKRSMRQKSTFAFGGSYLRPSTRTDFGIKSIFLPDNLRAF